MTKGLSTLPNIREQTTVKQHFYLNFLSLTAALWTNTKIYEQSCNHNKLVPEELPQTCERLL